MSPFYLIYVGCNSTLNFCRNKRILFRCVAVFCGDQALRVLVSDRNSLASHQPFVESNDLLVPFGQATRSIFRPSDAKITRSYKSDHGYATERIAGNHGKISGNITTETVATVRNKKNKGRMLVSGMASRFFFALVTTVTSVQAISGPMNKYSQHMKCFLFTRICKNSWFKGVSLSVGLTLLLQGMNPMCLWAFAGDSFRLEAAGFTSSGVVDLVNPHAEGFSYNIPLMSVGGYPLSVVRSSDITMDREVPMVGLGWNLNVGSITKSIHNTPDGFRGGQVAREFNMKKQANVGAAGSSNHKVLGVGWDKKFLSSLPPVFRDTLTSNDLKNLTLTRELNSGTGSLSYLVTDLKCGETNTGAIDIKIPSGFEEVTYEWSTGATTQDVSGLAPGEYAVTVNYSQNSTSYSDQLTNILIGYEMSFTDLNSGIEVVGNELTLATDGFGFERTENEYSGQSAGWVEYTYHNNGSADHRSALYLKDKITNDVILGVICVRKSNNPETLIFTDNGISHNFIGKINNNQCVRVEWNGLGDFEVFKDNTPLYQLAIETNPVAMFAIGWISVAQGTKMLNCRGSDDCLGVAPPFQLSHAKLHRKLDGGHYLTDAKVLKFEYDEEYNISATNNKLTYNVYDHAQSVKAGVDGTGNVIVAGSPLNDVKYGDNRYSIDFTSLGLTSGNYYVLEVLNDKEEKWYLRFKLD